MSAEHGRPRILVVKLSDFGDALLTTPALARIRAALPEARIDALSTEIGAVAYRHSGLVDRVLRFEKGRYDRPGGLLAHPTAPLQLARRLRARGYDALALMHSLTTRFGSIKHAALCLASGAPVRAGIRRPGSPRGAFLTHWGIDRGFDGQHSVEMGLRVADALLEALDALPLPTEASRRAGLDHLRFEPGDEAEACADALLGKLAPRDATSVGRGPGSSGAPLVAVHPGSGAFSLARRWRPEGFAAVADGLARSGARILLVGRSGDGLAELRQAMAEPPALDLGDRTDLPGLAAVLSRCDLLLGNDSGVTHLATAMGCPVLALFGPSNPVAWGPWWPGFDRSGRPAASPHRILRLGLPCQPCFYVGHRRGSPRGCPQRDCLAWLPVEGVLDAALDLLGRSGKAPA